MSLWRVPTTARRPREMWVPQNLDDQLGDQLLLNLVSYNFARIRSFINSSDICAGELHLLAELTRYFATSIPILERRCRYVRLSVLPSDYWPPGSPSPFRDLELFNTFHKIYRHHFQCYTDLVLIRETLVKNTILSNNRPCNSVVAIVFHWDDILRPGDNASEPHYEINMLDEVIDPETGLVRVTTRALFIPRTKRIAWWEIPPPSDNANQQQPDFSPLNLTVGPNLVSSPSQLSHAFAPPNSHPSPFSSHGTASLAAAAAPSYLVPRAESMPSHSSLSNDLISSNYAMNLTVAPPQGTVAPMTSQVASTSSTYTLPQGRTPPMYGDINYMPPPRSHSRKRKTPWPQKLEKSTYSSAEDITSENTKRTIGADDVTLMEAASERIVFSGSKRPKL